MECLCPPLSYAEVLIPNVMVLGGGAIGTHRLGHNGGAPKMGFMSL